MKNSTSHPQSSGRFILNPVRTLCAALNLCPLFAVLFIISFSSVANAQRSLLTYYNFNEQTMGAATAATLQSDAPGLQTTTISSNFTTPASNVVVFGGTTLNQFEADTTGASGALSFVSGTGTTSGGGGNNGNSFQFTLSTLGFEDLVLSYATRGTSSGFTTQTLAYSTGGAFTNFSTQTNANSTAFNTRTIDLSSIAAVENVTSLTLRFTLTGATDTSGNNRFDNIQVTAVPEPGTILGGFALLGAVGFCERRRLAGLFGFRRA